MNNHPVTPANPPTAHDTQPTGRDTVHACEVPAAVVVSVPSEEAMLDLLMGLNTSGENPELPCLWVKDIGSPTFPNLAVASFVATLTEPDAAHVNYIASDEGGRSRCLMDCDNCGSEGDADWEPPGYPVQALVAVWPDEKRCRDDDLGVWWVAARDALTATPTPSADMVPAVALEGALSDIRTRRRESQRLDAADAYLTALDDAYGLVNNRLRAARTAPTTEGATS